VSRPLYCPWPRWVPFVPGAAFSFAPSPRCAGPRAVRTYLPPVGRARSQPPSNSPVRGAPASIRGRSSRSTGLRPFVADRNICNFLWYSVVASEGLRSDGVDDLPPSKSGSSILPIACIDGPGSYGAPAFRFAAALHPDALSPLLSGSARRAHNTRRCEHPSSGAPGPIGAGLCRTSENSLSRHFGE
jgi:hypothetical protein